MSTVNGFQVGSETLKYNYESLDNYNTPNFSASSSTAYAVGDYVMYNGKLYKCTTATTGGTWVSGSWTEAVLSDDMSDLNRQLNTGLINLENYIQRGRVLNGQDSPTLEPEINNNWVYAIIPCTAGEIFRISGSGGESYRPYSFVTGNESPYTTLEMWPSITEPAQNITVTAPDNTTFLIFNSRASFQYSINKVYYPPIYSEYVDSQLNLLDAKVENAKNTFLTTYENGIQDWWCYPVGYYYKNLREKTYYTFVDSQGNQGVFEYDFTSKETHKKILDNSIIDEHCTPSVVVLQNGKILVACTGHNSTSYINIYISKNVESIIDFEEPVKLSVTNGTLSYVQILYINNKYWLFTRYSTTNHRYSWYYATSDDGNTWSNLNPFIDGVTTQCYLMVRNYTDTLLKVYETTNPADRVNTAIRMCFIDTSNGNILDVDDSVIANINTMELPIPYTDLHIVLDIPDNTSLTQRLLSCGNGNDMAIAISRVNASNGTATPYYAIGDYNTTTHTYTLIDFPYLGSIFQAYYTQHIEIVNSYFVASTNLNAGKTIEVYTRQENTFTKVQTIADEAFDSNINSIKLLRPFQIINKNGIIYEKGMRSPYSYTDYYTDLLIGLINS